MFGKIHHAVPPCIITPRVFRSLYKGHSDFFLRNFDKEIFLIRKLSFNLQQHTHRVSDAIDRPQRRGEVYLYIRQLMNRKRSQRKIIIPLIYLRYVV